MVIRRQTTTRNILGKVAKSSLALPLAWLPVAYAQVPMAPAVISDGDASNATATKIRASVQPLTASDSALPTVEVASHGPRENPTAPTLGIVATRNLTATKINTSILQTPQSVSVVTRDQMDRQGATTIDAALRYTPGVYTQDSTDLRFDQLRGRGFSFDSYLDGLILQSSANYAVPRIDPYMLERIEVLHGPSSVLYGAGSPAGIVDMISKRPTEEAIHEIMLQIGNHNRYEVGFDMGGKVDNDGTILYRFTGLARDADTQVDGIKDQRISIAPAITIRPSRDTSLTILTSYQRDPAGGLYDSLPTSGSVAYNANGRISPSTYLGNPNSDYFHRTQYSLGYELTHHFNDIFTFVQKARYMHDDIDTRESYFGNYLSGSSTTVSENAFLDREHLSQIALDNQMQAIFNTGPVKQALLLGVDYQRALSGINSGSGSVGTLNVYNPNYSTLSTLTTTNKRVDTATDQIGVYLQDQLTYGRWTATLGARNDWANTATQTATSGVTTALTQQSSHAFTWRGGLTYTFDTGIAPYFGYTKSFSPTIGSDYAGNTLKPTTGEQYEVGVRYKPANYNAMYSAALFDLTQQNVATTDLLHTGYYVQTGEVRSRGLELEAHMDLTRSLSAIASYTYLNQVTTQTNTASALGKRLTMAPRDLASFWLDYTLHGGLARGLGFGGGVRFVGPSAGDTANTFDVPSVVLFDAAVHYDLKNWRLGINASNLGNRTYVAYCSGGACYFGSKLAVMGTARYQW